MITNLNSNDYKSITQLVQMETHTLQTSLRNILQKHYDKVVLTRDYLYAVGDMPIGLAAHLDTVFPKPPSEVFYDRQKGVLWSPGGAGFDDRAGVFLILKILAAGYRPSVIFTLGEEIGAVGASALVYKEKEPFAPMKYIIQLDRRGTNDCVFYDCDNKDFIKYVSSFGFIEAFGSFTDISVICPAWKIAGVNLSVGYRDEHTASEVLFVSPLMSTLNKVKNMLDDVRNTHQWNYVRSRFAYDYFKSIPGFTPAEPINEFAYYDEDWSPQCICSKCGQEFSEYEVFPVKSKDNTTKFYCPDCVVDGVAWCDECGEAFETSDPKAIICPDCKKAREKKWIMKTK